MTKKLQEVGYRVYWLTWLALLILTLGMIFLSYAAAPKLILVTLLTLAMFTKAALISGYFMHLRFEKLALVLAVALGMLFTAAALFFLIAPDGVRILKLSLR